MMFHWICTVQVFSPDGQVKISYQHGQCESLPGETRTDIFNKLFNQVTREVLRPGDSVAVPLFFSLEPMQLTASSQEAEYRVWGLQVLPRSRLTDDQLRQITTLLRGFKREG